MKVKKMTPEEIRLHKGISFPGVTTVFMCHDGQGRLLLAKRSKNARDEQGRWDVGGGGLKHGQAIEDNLRREVLEEYGAKPKKVEFIGYMDAFRKTPEGQSTHWVALYFAVLVDPKRVKIGEPEMIDAIGWYTLDNLPSPQHSLFPKFFKLHGQRLRELIGATPSG